MVPRLVLDLERRTMAVEEPGAPLLAVPLPPELAPDALALRRVEVESGGRQLMLTFAGGEQATVEVGTPGPGQLPPPGLPVVYLDQNHWVTLARRLYAPEKVAQAERAAATQIIELARGREILLPLSGAHLTETVIKDGHQRRHLATAMLTLSRGWQMRNPVRVRQQELRRALSEQPPTADSVFTLAPGVIFAQAPRPPDPLSGVPPEVADLHDRVVSVLAIYDAMLSDERLHSSEGRERAAAWAHSHGQLAEYMRQQRTSRDHARLNARGRLLADLSQEVATAAAAVKMPQADFQRWLSETTESGFIGMPYLSRLEQLVYQRLRNADDRWEGNDLNDMQFLACAAGYADVVVGEKKMSSYLTRVTAPTPGAQVCRRLAEAVELFAAPAR